MNPKLRALIKLQPQHTISFANTCCREKANGQFCECGAGENTTEGAHDFSTWEEAQKSGVTSIASGHRGKFWLNTDGVFVRPPGKVQQHLAVIPPSMQTPRGPDYKAFAHETGAIRIIVSPDQATIHMWENPTPEQREALTQLIRQTVFLQGDLDNGMHYDITYKNGSAEDRLPTGLATITRFIRANGEVEPKQEVHEFKNSEPVIKRTPVMRLQQANHEFYNQYHDERGRFTDAVGAVAGTVIRGITENEGATVDPKTGKDVTSGVVVGGVMKPVKIPASDFSTPEGKDKARAAIKAWLLNMSEKDVFDQGFKVGAWHNTATGRIEIEPTQVVDSVDEAKQLGKQRHQISVFDLNTFTEHETGGSGNFVPSESPLKKVGTTSKRVPVYRRKNG